MHRRLKASQRLALGAISATGEPGGASKSGELRAAARSFADRGAAVERSGNRKGEASLMTRIGRVFMALLALGTVTLGLSAGAARADGPMPATIAPEAGVGPPLGSVLDGSTLSAVIYVPHPPGFPGGGELSRFMFQAYLRADGSAMARVWDEARDSYTEIAERRWTLDGSKLCVDLSRLGPGPVCADVHVWGPRIAGINVKPYAMLDGDLTPGDALGAR
jgi:hypothetical protein